MCCYTHDYRDRIVAIKQSRRDLFPDFSETLDLVEPGDQERCQCSHNGSNLNCFRRMGSETLRCEWCWDNQHDRDPDHKICAAVEYEIFSLQPELHSRPVPVQEVTYGADEWTIRGWTIHEEGQ